MIGGNIPGETRVLSIAIFDFVETLEWGKAHFLSACLLLFSFAIIFTMTRFERYVRRTSEVVRRSSTQ